MAPEFFSLHPARGSMQEREGAALSSKPHMRRAESL